jgi:adenosylmethionine-8-amino-7-oxononanoate aminotransferase
MKRRTRRSRAPNPSSARGTPSAPSSASVSATTQVRASPQSLWYPYAQMRGLEIQNEVARAVGTRLYLADGRVLVDAIASWWCVIHGYNHPELNAVLRAQLEQFAHVMLGGLTHGPAQRLADRLVALAPAGLAHVFFADSGSVGMEVAMKMAVQYWRNLGVRGKHAFVSLRHGYHGDTTGVMSLGDPDEGMHRCFGGYLPRQHFVHPPEGMGDGRGEIRRTVDEASSELRAVLRKHGRAIAALACEPLMQAAGGFNFYPAAYLAEARRLCDEHEVLLICDEVATGFGRTGTLFGCQQAGITPDIMVLGKGLSAGYLGLSATLATDRVFGAFLGEGRERAFMHGPTFMGNALACSVALASIDIFERDGYLAKIRRIEDLLRAELVGWRGRHIRETRVFGACGVVEVDDERALVGLQDFAAAQGVWLRPFDRVAYTMPAYVMDEASLRLVCRTMQAWFERS